MAGNDNVLVDTSAWLDFYHGDERVIDALAPLMRLERVVVCGMVRQEVMRGSRDESMLTRMHDEMAPWLYEAERPEDFLDAARIYARLRWKGVTVTAADCLIAAVAKRCGLEVCATDPHFAKIPGLRLFPI